MHWSLAARGPQLSCDPSSFSPPSLDKLPPSTSQAIHTDVQTGRREHVCPAALVSVMMPCLPDLYSTGVLAPPNISRTDRRMGTAFRAVTVTCSDAWERRLAQPPYTSTVCPSKSK